MQASHRQLESAPCSKRCLNGPRRRISQGAMHAPAARVTHSACSAAPASRPSPAGSPGAASAPERCVAPCWLSTIMQLSYARSGLRVCGGRAAHAQRGARWPRAQKQAMRFACRVTELSLPTSRGRKVADVRCVARVVVAYAFCRRAHATLGVMRCRRLRPLRRLFGLACRVINARRLSATGQSCFIVRLLALAAHPSPFASCSSARQRSEKSIGLASDHPLAH